MSVQMAVSKAAVRDIVGRCEENEGAAIPQEDYDSDGGIDELKIFCAMCRNNVSTDVSLSCFSCKSVPQLSSNHNCPRQ